MISAVAIIVSVCVLSWLCYREYEIHQDPFIYSAIIVVLTALTIFFFTYK